MFIVRSVKMEDLESLYELSQLTTFINLPADRNLIQKKIQKSINSFHKPSAKFFENFYIFILEDCSTGKVIGTSMIHSQHGTEEEPHFFLKVGQENKFSKSLNTGFIHGTLKLGIDTDGPTEIGGLILHPDYRRNDEKLGKVISFSRFLYMGMNPQKFKQEILSELMPPFDSSGNSPLWEAIGRRFLNMNYTDADILSRENKEFILSLYPSDTIYVTLLPTDARNAIGKVGEETLPVKRMLEKIGFKYMHEVDPFDGGPHYKVQLNDIALIKNMLFGKIVITDNFDPKSAVPLLISTGTDKDFSAVRINAVIKIEKVTEFHIDPAQAQVLSLDHNYTSNAVMLS